LGFSFVRARKGWNRNRLTDISFNDIMGGIIGLVICVSLSRTR
jgi:hypothetical protein